MRKCWRPVMIFLCVVCSLFWVVWSSWNHLFIAHTLSQLWYRNLYPPPFPIAGWAGRSWLPSGQSARSMRRAQVLTGAASDRSAPKASAFRKWKTAAANVCDSAVLPAHAGVPLEISTKLSFFRYLTRIAEKKSFANFLKHSYRKW